jgi:hypothetical protein
VIFPRAMRIVAAAITTRVRPDARPPRADLVGCSAQGVAASYDRLAGILRSKAA